MKIIDRIKKRQEEGQPFFSFEYFSPKTAQGLVNLHDRIERMCHLGPEFVDITWGAGGSRPAATMEVVSHAQKVYGVETCLHLICTNNPTDKIDQALKEARACGNQNILALRGDPAHGQKEWTPCAGGLCFASDLVKYIRQTHGDYFGIGVAGYPEAHPESTCSDQDLKFLKAKIDAGADFIVTQLFFDVPLFLNWVKKCRAIGIDCPILPGLMPIQSYGGFAKNTVGLSVPSWIRDGIEAVKHDDQAVREFGVQVGIKMTKELIAGGVPGIHFYTFNLEKSTRLILEGSGLLQSTSTTLLSSKQSQPSSIALMAGLHGSNLGSQKKCRPWRYSFDPRRRSESVRPIFWNNKPKSYISRTESWTRFPSVTWPSALSVAAEVTHHEEVELREPCWSPRPRSDSGSYIGQHSPFLNAQPSSPSPSSSSSTSTSSPSLSPSPFSSTISLPLSSSTSTSSSSSSSFIASKSNFLSCSPYGGLDGYGTGLKCSTAQEAEADWGSTRTQRDLQDVFARYCRGETLALPWCDQGLPLPPLIPVDSPSTDISRLREQLAELASLGGYLPVNAQSAVEAVNSEDKTFGWGSKGGQVYQKEYLEFFISPERLDTLIRRIQYRNSSSNEDDNRSTTFGALNQAGDLYSNMAEEGSTYVLNWGVFPTLKSELTSNTDTDEDRETATRTDVATVIDIQSFKAWKEEAFALWDQWTRCYPDDSKSHQVLKKVAQNWYLMFIFRDEPGQESGGGGVLDLFKEDLQKGTDWKLAETSIDQC